MSSRKKYSVLSEAANIAEALNLPWAAIQIMDESLRGTEGSSLMERLVALRWRAVLLTRLGRDQEARQSIALAQRSLSGLNDPDAGAVLMGDLLAVQGEVLARTDPDGAINQLSSAVGMYQSSEQTQQLEELLLQRGRVQASLSRMGLAEADFGQAIDLLESMRRRTPENERETFLDKNREVYDRMAEVQFAMDRKLAALSYGDEARSRVLIDRITSADPRFEVTSEPDVIQKLQAQIPGDVAIVAYSIVGTTCRAWIVHREGIDVVELTASSEAIEQAVESLQGVAEGHSAEGRFRAVSMEIFDLIVRPILDRIKDSKRIVFVPDGCLFRIPFPALLDRVTGHFLVESFEIEIAPSVRAYGILAQKKESVRKGLKTPALIVGGAIMERHSWASLSSLQASADEAKRISDLYPGSVALVGKHATSSAFIREAPRHQLIHIAAHSIHSLGESSLSFLVLSADRPGETGILYPVQISKLRLNDTRVVFINSCQSMGARVGRTEGVTDLVGAFLGAGAPTVIASIWRIDDARSSRFAISYHEFLGSGLDPSVALRLTQLEYIHGRKPGGWVAWSAYEAFGA